MYCTWNVVRYAHLGTGYVLACITCKYIRMYCSQNALYYMLCMQTY